MRRQRAVGVDPEAAPGLDALRRSEPHEQRLEITASRGRQSEYLVETDGAEFIEPLEKQDSEFVAPAPCEGDDGVGPARGEDKPMVAILNLSTALLPATRRTRR